MITENEHTTSKQKRETEIKKDPLLTVNLTLLFAVSVSYLSLIFTPHLYYEVSVIAIIPFFYTILKVGGFNV